jgi:Arm DNA-binding domain
MPISAAEIHTLKPRNTPHKVFLGGAAYLLLRPNGKKYWRLAYHLNGKEGRCPLGVFRRVSVGAAKAARDSARTLIEQGLNPSLVRRETRVQSAPTHVLQLQLSTGALTIEADGSPFTLSPPQTHGLAAFLRANNTTQKDSQ